MASDSEIGREEGEEEQEVRHVPSHATSRLFDRSPYVHNPPQPEERRGRVANPSSLKDYIINLREDLADFQESHGLPRSNDYNFLSLGLSLAQETGRAIYSILLLVIELFPIVPIVSLVLKFSLDKTIEILETEGAIPRIKKAAIFMLQLIVLMIPLWILFATIIIPILCLLISIIRRLFHLTGRKPKKAKSCGRSNIAAIKTKKKKMSFI